MKPDNVVNFLSKRGKAVRGNFFAVDRRAWNFCMHLGINAQVAYLVLCCGGDKFHKTTKWSVNAIERYTSVSRHRAQKAIDDLIAAGLISRKPRNSTRPAYWINSATDIEGCEGYVPADLEVPDDARRPEWLWLPSELVTGAADEVPPVELLRQTQSVTAIWLLVAAYYDQNLQDFGGIHPRTVRREHKLAQVGQRGALRVFEVEFSGAQTAYAEREIPARFMTGKRDPKTNRHPGMTAFWDALDLLGQLGLTEDVPHLFDGPGPDASLIFPFAVGEGEGVEHEVAEAARRAGLALLAPTTAKELRGRGVWVVPIEAHRSQATMIGVTRLRYKPKTWATAAWTARFGEWRKLVEKFHRIAEQAEAENAGRGQQAD